MEWNFGELYSQIRVRSDGRLSGASFMPNNGARSYRWEAVPVTAFEDDYASSLASIPETEFPSFVETPFRYRPFSRTQPDFSQKFFKPAEFFGPLDLMPIPDFVEGIVSPVPVVPAVSVAPSKSSE